MSKTRVAIIGCGLIGHKRAAALASCGDSELVVVADIESLRAEQLAREYHCESTSDWEKAVQHPEVDVVVVSTVNKSLAPVTIAAARNGKHVLCEKPLGRSFDEASQMVQAARDSDVRLKTGFNHRYHPAIRKAHEIVCNDGIGQPYFIRCVYGHGGRPGYDKEWRADADLAGGGELLDQGVHVVDLCRWFLGDFAEATGFTSTYFWDLGSFRTSDTQSAIRNLQLEDNAFALLRTSSGQVASLHTSWTQWKNRFSFEVFGQGGYVTVEGLGSSYGIERLTWGKRRPESGPPQEEHFEFSGPDRSWHDEWSDFVSAIKNGHEPLANGIDGLEAMRLIEAIYQSSRTGKVVRL